MTVKNGKDVLQMLFFYLYLDCPCIPWSQDQSCCNSELQTKPKQRMSHEQDFVLASLMFPLRPEFLSSVGVAFQSTFTFVLELVWLRQGNAFSVAFHR